MARGSKDYLRRDVQRLNHHNRPTYDKIHEYNCLEVESSICSAIFQSLRRQKGIGGLHWGFQGMPGSIFVPWDETKYVVDQSLVPLTSECDWSAPYHEQHVDYVMCQIDDNGGPEAEDRCDVEQRLPPQCWDQFWKKHEKVRNFCRGSYCSTREECSRCLA